jgi:3'-phosphoadenosine 5'-phosphosulfate sulfotransferase (PAPS reductase)/FAD synthetase
MGTFDGVVVMFSSGAGSWAAAKRAVKLVGARNVKLLFCDVKGDDAGPHDGEDPDNYRFLNEAAKNVGAELVTVRDGRSVWDVFRDERIIGNTRIAPCSKRLKQEPARKWIEANCSVDATLVVGIDWSEAHRLPAIERGWAPYKTWAPLTEAPYVDKTQVLAMLRAEGIEPPRLYAQGFAHANCGGFCVRGGQAHFKTLLEQNPERYAYHEAKEQEMRDFLGKDVSILRDRKGGTVKPLPLTVLRKRIEDESGQVDEFDFGGCGCFVDQEFE